MTNRSKARPPWALIAVFADGSLALHGPFASYDVAEASRRDLLRLYRSPKTIQRIITAPLRTI